MTDGTRDNLVLFPKTLDYYQIQLTKMLETERYGDAKALLNFLLQCHGEADRHHTEWQALLGWLVAAFPDAESDSDFGIYEEDDDQDEEDIVKRKVIERFESDTEYIPQLLATLYNGDDPEQQLLILGQLMHIVHPDIELSLRQWLARKEYIPPVQFRALQALQRQGATGSVSFWRDGESIAVDAKDTPASFAEFPQGIHQVLDRVRQTAEVSDPTLSYFAEEMWKECVETAYGTSIYKSMIEDDDGSADLWGAALHQLLMEKLHGKQSDEWIREQYGITGELRFRYEQALRWLRQYSVEPRLTGI
ncbi:hypothetical protein [Cohnella cholangitidis]|uniref:Uncharacterized protein n=1 Tax=Cohnella cholangitidis TaxID=2598458 RepID=A0A7G5C3J9_9BACL|nr:hypothetical protein [Cohnella cholangitidis]QMV43783.1 hypothetical protein FPL14_23375 [Cohnella cholangitidis]